jgi:glyoxylase-like metal-dependent hydrolase (beta-lactamase superfamily II)
MTMPLPPPVTDQPYFKLTPLESGHLTLKEEMLVSNPEPNKCLTVPTLSFLLQHSSGKHKVLFDLGIRKDLNDYPPVVVESIGSYFFPCGAEPDVGDALRGLANGVSEDDITHVIISHIHWWVYVVETSLELKDGV